MVKFFRAKAKQGAEVDVDGDINIHKTRTRKFWARKIKTVAEDNARDEGNDIDATASSRHLEGKSVNSSFAEAEVRESNQKEKTVGLNTIKDSVFSSGARENANIAVTYSAFGDIASDVMKVVMGKEVPVPNNPTDVVVKIEASTVSVQDCIIRRGMWYERMGLPQTPGFDVVGVIDKIGDKVMEEGIFKEGDRVAALVRTGGNARFIVLPSESLVKVPREVGSATAAAVVTTYMTAFQALNIARGSRETEESLQGKKILVTGGSGTVGRAIIQIARWAGADTIYATAHEKDHKSLEALGAIALPFSHQKWLPKVKGYMDIVIDGLCVDGLKSPHEALNNNGRLVCIGMTSVLYSSQPGIFGMPGNAIWTSVKANFMSRTTTFDLWESFQNYPDVFKSDLQFLFNLVKSHEIKPSVSKKIPLSDVSDAQERLEKGLVSGQLVCQPWKRFVYRTPERDAEMKDASSEK